MFRQNSHSIRRHIAKHENPELSSIGSHRIFRRKRHKIWYSGLCDRWRQQKMSFAMFNIANKQLQKISYFYVGTKMRESLAQKLHTQAEHLFHNNKTVHASRSASYLEWSAEFNLNFVPIRMLQFERCESFVTSEVQSWKLSNRIPVGDDFLKCSKAWKNSCEQKKCGEIIKNEIGNKIGSFKHDFSIILPQKYFKNQTSEFFLKLKTTEAIATVNYRRSMMALKDYETFHNSYQPSPNPHIDRKT